MSTALDAWLLPGWPAVWDTLGSIRRAYLVHLEGTSGTDWPAEALTPKLAQLVPVTFDPLPRGRGGTPHTVMRLPHWTPWDTDALLAPLVKARAVATLRCDTRSDPEPGDIPSEHPVVDYVDQAIRGRRYWLWPLIDQDDLDRWRRT